MTDVDIKREKYARIAKFGVVALVGLLVAPFIYLAIKGIIGLAIAALVIVALVNAAPWIGMKFANWKLKGIKAEAAANPIETLQNVYTEKDAALKRFLNQIEDFAAHVKQFETQVVEFSKQYPQDAASFQEKLENMRALLTVRRDRYRQAKATLAKFDAEIQRANAVWLMSQSAQALTKAAGMGTDDPYEKIKANTAIEAVERSMNVAMAELETTLLEEEDMPAPPGAKQIEPTTTPVAELPASSGGDVMSYRKDKGVVPVRKI